MSALIVADVFSPDTVGGAGRVARQLAQGLAREMPVVVVCRNEGGQLPPFEMADGLEIHRYFVDRSRPGTFFASSVRNSVALVRWLSRQRRFERLILNQPLSGVAALPLMGKVPSIYTFHSPWFAEYCLQIGVPDRRPSAKHHLGIWARKRIERSLVQRSSRVLVLSDYMAGHLCRLHHTPWERISKIPGGVDVERFCPGSGIQLREELGLPADAEIILTVRNLVARMGLPRLIEAFAWVARKRPKTYLVIGGDGPLKSALKRQVSELGLTEHVRLLGRVPDHQLPNLYRAADVFALATRALEGFGLVTIEALASGVPVIATPVGASPEILTQLDGSLLARSSSVEHIAQALDEFFDRSPAERQRLAELGRQLCFERYSWQAVTQAFNELVTSVR